VGHGRALPAPFGFDNGIFPDGVDDYLTVPGLIGKPIPDQFTVEFWVKFPDPVNDLGGIFRLATVGGQNIMISRSNSPLTISSDIADQGAGLAYTLSSDTRLGAIAHSFNMATGDTSFYSPSAIPSYINKSNLLSSTGANIQLFEFFTPGTYTTQNSNAAIDEFRLYNKIITNEQFLTNYNAGIGNNPFETESLLVWLKFEKFEMLDFSALQDGSDLRLGIRDFSGLNHHALPFNMDTNPASGNYVLKSF